MLLLPPGNGAAGKGRGEAMPNFGSGVFSGLQFRLALGFAIALALALALVGLAAGLVAETQTQRFERDRDSAQVSRIREFVSEHYAHRIKDGRLGDDGGLQEILERAGPVSGFHIQVYDYKGVLVADSHSALASLAGGKDFKGWRELEREIKKFPVFRDGEQVAAFTVSPVFAAAPGFSPASLDPAASRISDVVDRSLLWGGVGAAALGIGLVWVLSGRMLAPLQNLGAAARRLGQGDLSQRAEAAGPGEIRQLALSFNQMAAGLEEAERHRRNLTADVAHELRTPLSNIQGYLEAIKDGLIQPTPETIDTIHGQAAHLSRLVEDLRLLAQVDAGALELRRAPTAMGDLLLSGVEAVRPRAEGKGVGLGLEVAGPLPVAAVDATRIAQVVGNLLENAITHTPEGGRVTVSGRAEGGWVEVAVADTGRGIAPEDLPRVFDRFYRADPSRARATGGAGLGLTIARRLVEAHGGTIEAESAAGQGSRFVLRLPAAGGG